MLLVSIIFSSCKSGDSGFGKFYNDFYKANEKEVANAKLEELLNAIQNKDQERLRSLFAKNALSKAKDFDMNMEKLLDYYEGDYISYDDWGGPLTEEETIDAWIKTIKPSYDIKTSKRSYRVAFELRTVDTGDSDNIGLWSIDIIKAENDNDLTYAYWGDLKYTPGINIDIKNIDE